MSLASNFLLRSKRIHTLKYSIFTRRNTNASLNLRQAATDFKPFIQTLDPSKLLSRPQNVYDISLRKTLFVVFRTLGGGTSCAQLRFQSTKEGNDITQDIPFPTQTRGVFYYHVDPQLPPTSGGVRFRLCDSLEAFDKGEDLHVTVGKPWEVSLTRIARLIRLKELSRFLVEEGLVEMNLVEDLRQLKLLGLPRRFVGLYLYHLSQPFVIDLESTALTIHLVTRKTYSFTVFHSPFYSSHKIHRPYVGIIKARFELSSLREHENKGPTLVLRILECLSPVQRISPLVSGPIIDADPINSLVMRQTSSGTIKPWSYSLDRRTNGLKWKEFIAASSN